MYHIPNSQLEIQIIAEYTQARRVGTAANYQVFARCYCSQVSGVGLFSLFSALLLLLQLCQRFLLLWLCSNVLRLLGNVVRVP